MPRLIFKTRQGRITVDAEVGSTVMLAARNADVPGIVAECGGCATCMTCHAYLDEAHLATVPPPDASEAAMLEHLIDGRATSRLTCQIKVAPELDGLELTVPDSQG